MYIRVSGGPILPLAVSHLLYGISPENPTVPALGAGVLVLAAIVACLAPARRAARVDPLVALRAE